MVVMSLDLKFFMDFRLAARRSQNRIAATINTSGMIIEIIIF